MANKFRGMEIRAVDSNDDVKRIGLWGDVQAADYDAIAAHLDAGVAEHGLLVVGRIEKYYDDAVDLATVVPPAGKEAISGQIVVNRQGAGPVFMKGKFPNQVEDLDLICAELINGAKTIGGSSISEVKPRVNTGRRFIK